jgi:glycosyltransferase involved in cell wall biosynthesis
MAIDPLHVCGMTRVAVVAPDDWTIWCFYRHLIAALQSEGAEVTAFTADGPHVPRLLALGMRHVAVPYARFVDPLEDVRLYRTLRRVFTEARFEIVQNITIKANLFGALAAAAAGVDDIVNTVEGAGLLYSDGPSRKVRAIRAIAELGLRRARRVVAQYWFVNERDRDVFVQRGLADPERSVVAIATGVDTKQFDPETVSNAMITAFRDELGIPAQLPIVVNVAGRLLRSKGIAEFIEAARILKERGVEAQFVLVGPEEPNHPDAFPITALRDAVQAGIVKWVSFREDVWTVYAAATVAVVVTYYAEGTPKGVLEGMAMARPIVCSDVPSIRALVSHGKDGMLVKTRSGPMLAETVASLLASPGLRKRLGAAGRTKALTEFDAELAARAAVEQVYGRLPAWRGR